MHTLVNHTLKCEEDNKSSLICLVYLFLPVWPIGFLSYTYHFGMGKLVYYLLVLHLVGNILPQQGYLMLQYLITSRIFLEAELYWSKRITIGYWMVMLALLCLNLVIL